MYKRQGVEIINTGEKIAQTLTTYLQENNINSENKGQDIIYLTDTECNFIHVCLGSGNGEKNEKYKCRKYNGNKNQGNEKSSRNVTGAAGRNPMH